MSCSVEKSHLWTRCGEFHNEVHDLCVHRKLSTRKTDLRRLNLSSIVLLNNSFSAAAFVPPANTSGLYFKLFLTLQVLAVSLALPEKIASTKQPLVEPWI